MAGNTPNTPKKPTNKSNQMTVSQAVNYNTMTTGAKAAARREAKLQLAIRRQRRADFTKKYRKRLALNALGGERCYPSTQVYGGASQGDKKWICSNLHQITFREKNYDIRECEVRVFIEGAEVTAYVRGTISWSIQSTGGMNSCTFSLNNNHDAFILTPANVCSRTDLHGWRVPLDTKKRLITAPGRITRNVDETAKYIIYKNKYERVRPGTKGQQINEAGFWLYPLNPFFSIINKHDCVRVFYRLPHVTGVCKTVEGACVRGKHAEYDEVWAPAFAGFVDEYDFEDDPVAGDRVMNIRCYDWRGLLNRMRVRMQVNPAVSAAAARKAQEKSPIFDEQKKAQKKEGGKGGTTAFLDVTSDLGINKDLIELYQVLFDAKAALCKQGGNYTACTQEAHKNVRQLVAAKIAEMKLYYLGGTGKYPPTKDKDGKPVSGDRIIFGVKPAQKAILDAEGIKIELKRTAKDSIGTKASAKGVAGATEAILKATKFLTTTGKQVDTLSQSYVTAYFTISTDAVSGVNTDVTAVNPAAPKPRTSKFKLANGTVAVKTVDAAAATTIAGTGNLFGEAGLGTNPNTNRVYLLNQYVVSKVQGFFSGVADKIKAEIDDTIRGTTTVKTDAGTVSLVLEDEKVKGIGRVLFGLSRGGSVLTRAIVAFTIPGTYHQVATLLNRYIIDPKGLAAKGKIAKSKLTGELANFNAAYKAVRALLLTATADALAALKKDPNKRRRAKLDELRKKYDALRKKAQGNPTAKSEVVSTVADLVQTDARFNQIAVGMYGDLVRSVALNSHPLAGMSFETAIEWLTLTHTPISKGFEDKLQKYDRGELQTWNMNVLFGVIGRPLTYREVTAMGAGTLSDIDTDIAPYSPLNPFMHMLLPKDGTGASSIVQQDITHNSFATKDYTYQTRLDLINQICKTLDYQFFVSPAGDLVFEFPNYNSMPYDFGKVFQGAYTIVKGLRNFKVASEQGDLNTAWVITGKETDKAYSAATSSYTVKNTFKKNVIVANILARRVGIKVRYIQIELPGVGAVLRNIEGVAEATRIAYGLLEIQRELGRMETASVSHDFRPYMLPNRPVHIVHRQRMALIRSVSYSMSPPNGECNSSLDLHYIRGLHQDGSFRHIAGGTRLPVDYSGLYTGDVAQTIRFGAEPRLSNTGSSGGAVRNFASQALAAGVRAGTRAESTALRDSVLQTTGQRQPRSTTNWACGPYLKDRWITASASYSDQMDSSFRKADTYSSWTQGSNGLSGELAPLPRGGASYIAKRNYRPASAKGDPAAAATLVGTGLDDASAGSTDAKNPTKTKPKDAFYGNLYNPWPYGRRVEGHINLFNQFGFYRVIFRNGRVKYTSKSRKADRKAGRKNHRSKLSGWHNGIDFNGNTLLGVDAYTPIALESTILTMGVAWNGYKTAGKYRWTTPVPSFGPPPAVAARFGVANASKYNRKAANTSRVTSVNGVPHTSYLIDTSLERLFNKLKSQYRVNSSTPMVSPRYGGNQGMMLTGWGYASMPGSTGSKIACQLRYIHTGGLVRHKGGKHWIGEIGIEKEKRLVAADSPVIKVGTSGTNNIHLHFEMSIFKPGSNVPALGGVVGGDGNSYKEVLKANKEFLRTQMAMRLSAGGVGDLNKNVLSSSWKRYFARLDKKITTVDQAAEYMISRSKRYWNMLSPSSTKVTINPMFFFKPEQIIKVYADKYAKYRAAVQDNFFGSSGASVCGANNAVVQDKISLRYSVCLRNARNESTFSTKRNRRDARRVCRAVKKESKAKLTQRKIATGTVQQTGGQTHKERVQRKLDARTRASVNNSGNRTGTRSTSGS